MNEPYWMRSLARSSGSLPPDAEEAAHLALAEGGACLIELAGNMRITRAVWRRVWDYAHRSGAQKGNLEVSQTLVARSLAAPEVERAVATDSRASVLESLTCYNVLGPSALDKALSRSSVRKASSGASSLLLQPGLPSDRVDSLAASLNMWGFLRVLAFGPAGRIDRVSALRQAAAVPRVRSQAARRNKLLQVAFLRDRALADAAALTMVSDKEVAELVGIPLVGTRNGILALEESGTLAEAMVALPSSSRGFALMAVASNPAASSDTLASVAKGEMGGGRAPSMAASRLSGAPNSIPPAVDLSSESRPEVLKLCVARSLPGGLFNSAGRPERMLLLGGNDNLPGECRAQLVETFAEAAGSDRELWLTKEADRCLPGWDSNLWGNRPSKLDDSLTRLFTQAGSDRGTWASIVHLGPSWSGSMPDLVDTARVL